MARPILHTRAIIFSLTLLLVAALTPLPGEFSHYKGWLDLAPDEVLLRGVVALTLLAKTLFVMVSAFGLLVLASGWLGSRFLRFTSVGLAALVVAITVSDLMVQKATGNPLFIYLPYLLEVDTLNWAGEGLDFEPAARTVGFYVLLAVGLGSALGWLAEASVGRRGTVRNRVTLTLMVFLFVVFPLTVPFLQRGPDAPLAFALMSDRFLWPGPLSGYEPAQIVSPARSAIQGRFERALPALQQPRRVSGERPVEEAMSLPALGDLPDILLIVSESLRADALDPVTMPQVHKWSASGARFDQHYSSSNASHYGFFSLLYGETPLRYFDAIAGEERPALITELRRLGYSTHLLVCAPLDWRAMDRFMGERDFDVEQISAKSVSDCDQRVTERAAALLAPSDRTPRLVLAFLLSTHFGYHYPADTEPFQPSLQKPNALDVVDPSDREALRNRYRNSAYHLDAISGRLIEQLDPRRTLIVFTGDHGESLFDDGTLAHASRLSESQTRVPLIIAGPGVPSGKVQSGPTAHNDIARTVFSRLATDSRAPNAIPGRDLLKDAPREFVALVHAKASPGTVDQIALISGSDRFQVRLDRTRGLARFSGAIGLNGLPLRRSLSREEADRVAFWFDLFLSEATDAIPQESIMSFPGDR